MNNPKDSLIEYMHNILRQPFNVYGRMFFNIDCEYQRFFLDLLVNMFRKVLLEALCDILFVAQVRLVCITQIVSY